MYSQKEVGHAFRSASDKTDDTTKQCTWDYVVLQEPVLDLVQGWTAGRRTHQTHASHPVARRGEWHCIHRKQQQRQHQ